MVRFVDWPAMSQLAHGKRVVGWRLPAVGVPAAS